MPDKRQAVMIVDDNIANLKIAKEALSESYDVFTVPSAEKMFDLLERNRPELILLDVSMPEMDGYAALRLLKEKPELADIPVIFLTAKADDGSELTGLSLGAVDYITKPFAPSLLRKRVELHLTVAEQKLALLGQADLLRRQQDELRKFNANLFKMVEERTSNVVELRNAILKTVAELVENRDSNTGEHIGRTMRYMRVLIDEMDADGLYAEQRANWNVELLLQSSQLHDVGKIRIPDRILNKPGPLTPEEFEEMKKHAAMGVSIIGHMESMISENEFLRFAKVFAGTHHEKWDGSGYPGGLAGEDIPLPGRLLAVADVYDALTSDRPYKKAAPHEEAEKIILEGRGRHFDPALTDAFARTADKFGRLRKI